MTVRPLRGHCYTKHARWAPSAPPAAGPTTISRIAENSTRTSSAREQAPRESRKNPNNRSLIFVKKKKCHQTLAFDDIF